MSSLRRSNTSTPRAEVPCGSSGGENVASREVDGWVMDEFSACHPLGVASPVLTGLGLEDHGLSWAHAPRVVAHVGEDDDPGDDVEFLRADSWRAARDLARLHLPGAESVLVCLAPGADESAAQKFLSLARTRVSDGGSIDVMRLDAGSLVLMEVTHG